MAWELGCIAIGRPQLHNKWTITKLSSWFVTISMRPRSQPLVAVLIPQPLDTYSQAFVCYSCALLEALARWPEAPGCRKGFGALDREKQTLGRWCRRADGRQLQVGDPSMTSPSLPYMDERKAYGAVSPGNALLNDLSLQEQLLTRSF